MSEGEPTVQERRRTGFELVALTFALLVLALAAWFGRYVLLLTFAGVLFAIFLRTLANLLSKYSPLSVGWSLAVVVLLLIAITISATLGFGSQLATQFGDLVGQLPKSVDSVRQRLSDQPWGKQLLQYLPKEGQRSELGKSVAWGATSAATTLLGGITGLVIVLFVGLFLAADPEAYRHGLIKLIPIHRRKRGEQVLDEITLTLRWWLIGKFCSMAIVGALTTAGLWMLGVPLALALGVLAALLAFIPNIGPILSVVPAALLAAMQSPMVVLWVLLLYLVIQTIESYAITPIVQQHAVSLPPGLIIAAQVLLSILVGGLGLVLATPLTAAFVVLVRMVYVEDILGDYGARKDESLRGAT